MMMMDKGKRQKEFRRNEKLEELLKELNFLLCEAENKALDSFSNKKPLFPVIFIVGVPRCGSTLLLQWLSNTGHFSYPSNLLSRFYEAPYVGARIQQLLTSEEFNFNNEFYDIMPGNNYESNLGKTRGILAPNEFWYFWRRFVPNEQPEFLEENELAKIDTASFLMELAAIEHVFRKPFALKGHILEYNIPFLDRVLDKALFLFIYRHPFYNIQSLIHAREKYYGTRNTWYSAKPPEYNIIRDESPFEQVAGQVFFTEKAIKNGLENVDCSRKLFISYEDFCIHPESVFLKITEKLVSQGYTKSLPYIGQKSFMSTNSLTLAEKEAEEILKAYKAVSGKSISI